MHHLIKVLNEPCSIQSKYPDIDVSQFVSRIVERNGLEAKEPKVLILSDVFDFESDKIGRMLAEKGIPYLRINSSYIPREWGAVIGVSNESSQSKITSGSSTGSLDSVSVVFKRHFQMPKSCGVGIIGDAIYYQELEILFQTLEMRCDSWLVNGTTKLGNLSPNIKQLELAKRCGFKIPETHISTDYRHLHGIANIDERKWITKSLGCHHVIVNGVMHSYYAHEVHDAIFKEKYEKIRCPILIQERLSFDLDLRVTFVGSELYFTAIGRGENAENCVDYKSIGIAKLDMKIYVPPDELKKLCLKFIKEAGLDYGSIDLLYKEPLDYYFLEVNCVPDWEWVERIHNGEISKKLVQMIEEKI